MSKIDKRLTFPLLSTLISLLKFRSPTSEFHSDIMCAKLDKQQKAEGNGGRETNREEVVEGEGDKQASECRQCPTLWVVTMNTLSGCTDD